MDYRSVNVTDLLRRMHSGESEAAAELIPLIYDDLRRIAALHLRRERDNHTLQPTAIVHEVFIRLSAGQNIEWQNRAHFFAVASRVMRRILVDHARSCKSLKRGGPLRPVRLDEAFQYATERSLELLALDDALDQLAKLSPRQSRGVELRFFGGLREEEIAVLQGVSLRTVKRDWRLARAWLSSQLQP